MDSGDLDGHKRWLNRDPAERLLLDISLTGHVLVIDIGIIKVSKPTIV